MISRFFIDRPIFATVLSVVITLIGWIALAFLPVAQYPRITPPGVQISISYPGASAQVLADTVAAPIEQQVNGVEGMLYMSAQMGNDGTYSLTVTFDVGTDVKTALVKVQNRVSLAMQQLPTEVQNQGITIRKKTPDILMIVNLYSPNGRYDDVYLSNYATINVKDQLLRVDGVSDITYQGQRDYSVRAWLDPQKLAARNMTAIDVASAIRNQNLDAPAGQIGKPPAPYGQSLQQSLTTLGRLTTTDQFGAIIVKAGAPRFTPQPIGGKSASPSGGMGSSSSSSSSSMSSSSSGSSSSSSTSGSDSSGSSSSSTATTASGVTTSGGATSGGGAMTGGGATSSGGTTSDDGSISGISINSTSSGLGIVSGATLGKGTDRPSVSLVRLRDVARLELGAQNYNQACTFDGYPSVGLSVYQLPGTNALDVGDRVREKMEELKKNFPDDVDYKIGYDTTPFIRESVMDVFVTLLEAVALVGLVVLIFLQDWRAMLLPMIDVPVSLIGTFAVMAALSAIGDRFKIASLNFSLNNISLFGLVLAIGIVVDDAIVVLENIERMMAKGYDSRTAAIKAMEEVTGPIVAVSLVLCAVFLPCWFISGVTGQFFGQFAVTIAVSTVISSINAITMTPSRAVLLFKTKAGKSHEHSREALPWWFFGLLGGALTVWLLPKLLAGRLGLPAAPAPSDEAPAADTPKWVWWAITAAWFSPGLLVGGTIGWFIIRPVNAALGSFFRGFNRSFDRTAAGYGWIVSKLLPVSMVVLLVYCGLLGLTYWSFQKAPTGFIPQQDQGRLIVSLQLPDSASLQRTQEAVALIDKIARGDRMPRFKLTDKSFAALTADHVPDAVMAKLNPLYDKDYKTQERFLDALTRILDENELERFQTRILNQADRNDPEHFPGIPGVAHTVVFAGTSFILQASSPNFASMFMVLDPFDKRQSPETGDTAIMVKLRKAWTDNKHLTPEDQLKLKDIQVFVSRSSSIPGLGVAGGFKFIVEDKGGLGLPALQKQTEELVRRLKQVPGLDSVSTQFRSNTPQLYLDIDRTKVATLGVSLNDLNQTLDMYLGSLYVNSFNDFGRHWQVTIQSEGEFRSKPENISMFQVRNQAGQMVPLGALVRPRLIGGPISVTRYNLAISATVNGNIQGISTGDAINVIDETAAKSLPLSMKTEWTELMYLQLKAGNTAMYVFALSVICVFLALAALYESWSLPLAVILVVPLCLLCSVTSVLFTGRDVNIFVQIGLVVLVGLACKNAILIVEYARQLHQEGRSVFAATVEASRLRLRPILMTSFAFIFGVIPLMLASGAGAEMRRSLGTAVFSGMLGVTIFGIFLTPVFFYVILGLEESRLFASVALQRFISCLFGGLLGLAVGYLLGKLEVVNIVGASVFGVGAGVLASLTVFEIHRRARAPSTQTRNH